MIPAKAPTVECEVASTLSRLDNGVLDCVELRLVDPVTPL